MKLAPAFHKINGKFPIGKLHILGMRKFQALLSFVISYNCSHILHQPREQCFLNYLPWKIMSNESQIINYEWLSEDMHRFPRWLQWKLGAICVMFAPATHLNKLNLAWGSGFRHWVYSKVSNSTLSNWCLLVLCHQRGLEQEIGASKWASAVRRHRTCAMDSP